MPCRPIVLASLLAALAGPALAVQPVDPKPRCEAPAGLLETDRPLTRTTLKLALGRPLLVVAIGSSSTAGAGASSPDRAYPARLAHELAARYPESEVRLLNKGINGETADDMILRFDADVAAYRPDLVIWQTGTNSALTGQSPEEFRALLRVGVTALKATGADILLMEPQHAPRFDERPRRMEYVRAMIEVAAEERVALFPRHEIMRYWRESGRFDFRSMLSEDGLHLNDASYDCIAQLLAEQIETAVERGSTATVSRR